jgi:hypothetical protein
MIKGTKGSTEAVVQGGRSKKNQMNDQTNKQCATKHNIKRIEERNEGVPRYAPKVQAISSRSIIFTYS